MTHGVALAHDYATQRGGAERVALLLADAFPGSPMYTTLYDPAGTFPEFGSLDVRTSALDRAALLRRHHRVALPFLAPAVDRQRVEADVLLASSTGWAHGYRGRGAPSSTATRPPGGCTSATGTWGRRTAPPRTVPDGRAAATALGLLSPGLRRWDGAAARRADVYLANSTVTQRAIRDAYGIEAEVLAPPPAMLPDGEERAVPGVEPGFLLCVARLLPYKNVDVVVEAALATGRELVVVGDGPDRARLETQAARGGGRVRLLGRVDDATLRWVYRNAAALVAASYEDYGLSPLEAGAFGRPSVVLRDGGYLDTVVDGVNGVFFDAPRAELVAEAVEVAAGRTWDDGAVTAHVATFGRERFVERLRGVVAQQMDRTVGAGRPGGGRAQR